MSAKPESATAVTASTAVSAVPLQKDGIKVHPSCAKSDLIALIHASAIMSGWTKNLAGFPKLTQSIVDVRANETARIPRAKQTKGYSNFIEGYIHDVEGTAEFCYSVITVILICDITCIVYFA